MEQIKDAPWIGAHDNDDWGFKKVPEEDGGDIADRICDEHEEDDK